MQRCITGGAVSSRACWAMAGMPVVFGEFMTVDSSTKHEAPPLARRGLVSGLGLEADQFGQESVRFNMTRRFCWRPSAVSFEAIGFASPKPCDFRRDGSTPRDVR